MYIKCILNAYLINIKYIVIFINSVKRYPQEIVDKYMSYCKINKESIKDLAVYRSKVGPQGKQYYREYKMIRFTAATGTSSRGFSEKFINTHLTNASTSIFDDKRCTKFDYADVSMIY